MKKNYLVLVLFLFGIYTNSLVGQSTIFEQVEVQTTTVTTDTIGSGDNLHLSVTSGKELTTTLADTLNISSIRIKLGDTEGSSNLFNQTYAFSGAQISPSIWFERTLNRCKFGIGALTDKDAYYIRLEALNASNQLLSSYSTIAY